VFKQYYVRKQE